MLWNFLKPLLWVAGILYVIAWIVVHSVMEQALFPPAPASYAVAPEGLTLESSDGNNIAAVHLPAQPGRPTLLYSHGNAEDLGRILPLMKRWNDQGYGILAYDYPGYGRSSGKPSQEGCEVAISSAWNYLIGTLSVPPHSIVIVGRSLGGGPAVWLAAHKDPAGLVLISAFTSAHEIVLPISIFPGDRFPNLRTIRKVTCPLLILHGTDDNIVPVSHGQDLFDAATMADKRFQTIRGAGHNDLFAVAEEEIDTALETFTRRLKQKP